MGALFTKWSWCYFEINPYEKKNSIITKWVALVDAIEFNFNTVYAGWLKDKRGGRP